MKERIYIYNRRRQLINDPERSTDYAEGLNWGTQWPGGYGVANCRVKRDIAVDWLVQEANYFQVRRGQAECYYGRLDDLKKALDNSGQRVDLTAYGLWAALNERRVRKWWVDNHPRQRMHWPVTRSATPSQMYIDGNQDDDRILIRAGYGDISKNNGDNYYLRYDLPAGTYIHRVESTYTIRTGEGIKLAWLNGTSSTDEVSITWADGAEHTSSLNTNYAGTITGTAYVVFTLTKSDIYDENDRAAIYAMTVKSKYHTSHDDYAAPSWTTGEMMIDAILEGGLADVISSDWSQVIDPAYTPAGFASSNGEFEEVAKIVTRLASFGDSSFNTYGPVVWGVEGSTDNKPRFGVERRRTDKRNYLTSLAELSRFEHSLDFSQLHNYVLVKYTDYLDFVRYATPNDDSSLTDTTSVAKYGRRDSPVLDIGRGTAADAIRYGQRWLAYHKNPLPKGSMEITGSIRNGAGMWQPAALVRAGQVVQVADFELGTNFFLRGTHFDSDTQTLRMEPDSPPDQIAVRQAQLESGW